MTRTVHALGILHPAAILRGLWKEEPAQIEHLKKARRIAAEGWHPIDITQPPTAGVIFAPTPEELTHWSLLACPVAIDVEAAGPHLRLVGITRCDTEQSLQFPIRQQGGEPWPDRAMLRYWVEWLAEMLADPNVPKVFHNGCSYDIPEQLMEAGFVVRGYEFDTLLAAHIAYSEMPKRLSYLAGLFCDIPDWKHLAKIDPEGEAK